MVSTGSTDELPTGAGRLAGMDGLRGISALALAVGHVWLNLGTSAPLGPFAGLVQRTSLFLITFFVLSGFLLYRPFLTAAAEGRPVAVGRYLRNRALRIFPAYVVVLLVAGLVLGVATTAPFTVAQGMPPTLPETGWLVEHPLLLGVNLLLLQTFLPGTMMTGVGPAWSLSLELCFYLLLPLLAALGLGRLARRLGVRPSVGAGLGPALLVATGLVGKWIHVHVVLAGLTPVEAFFADWGPTWQAVFARSVLVHGDLFGIGMAAAVLFERWRRRPQARSQLATVAALGVGGLLVVVLLPTWHDTGWALTWAGVVLLVAAHQPGPGPGRVAGLLDTLPARWLGERAYGVYLWHLPAILLLAKGDLAAPQTTAGLALNCAVVVAVTCALAHLAWQYVERPVLQRKRARSAVE